MLPFHFFVYHKPIYHPKDLENVLYGRYALVQEKTYVKLITNINNGDTSNENPYFGHCDGGTWKQ